MKITTSNNAELVIQARDNTDYDKAVLVANRMVTDSCGTIEIACVDSYELWVHLTSCWNNFQASELRDAYREAKSQ